MNISNVGQGKVVLISGGNKIYTDIAARFWGEEFVVLLPDTDEIGAIKVAETLRANVEAM